MPGRLCGGDDRESTLSSRFMLPSLLLRMTVPDHMPQTKGRTPSSVLTSTLYVALSGCPRKRLCHTRNVAHCLLGFNVGHYMVSQDPFDGTALDDCGWTEDQVSSEMLQI